MKGVAGIVYPDVFQVNHLVHHMLDILQRGNSGQRDVFTHQNIQVGTIGDQLVRNDKKSIIGSYEGSINNITEINNELKKQGYNCREDNTSDILVHAYELWGTSFLEKIDGSFVIIILDLKKERLLLARDRIGKKTIYWYHDQNHFVFASQIKSLLVTGVVPQTPEMDTIASYLYFGYFPQDLTPIQGVSKLLPGHYLLYNFNKSKSIESFWSFSSFFQTPLRKHKNTIAHQLDINLSKAVSKRLPQKGPIGCFVSGGLGSASIAYYVHKLAKEQEVKAFSVAFTGENEDDFEAAGQVCKSLAIQQVSQKVTPLNFLDNLIPILWHLDEPVSDPNIVATWTLASIASEQTQTVFSGMGADELLAGHNRYTIKEQHLGIIPQIMHFPMPFLNRFIVPLLNFLYKPAAYRLLKAARTDPWQFEYLRQNAVFSEKLISHAAPRLNHMFDPEVFLHKFHHLSRVQSTVSSFLYFDVKTRLVDNFVLQYERMTNAHHLKWETPYLDHFLVEFLASLPEPEHLSESETATFLKVLMKQVYPSSFIERPKVSRPNFLSSWIKTSGLFEIFPLLIKGTLVETGIISEEWLHSRTANIETQRRSFRLLWTILVLEIWFRLFINRAIEDNPPNVSVIELLNEK